MLDLDALAPNFRRAADRWPEAPTLASQFKSLRTAYTSGDHGLVGVARSFVECVAQTIIGEFSSEAPDGENTTAIVNRALDYVGLRNTRVSSPLNAVLSAHNRLADALSEMRNHHDPNSHGKDGFLDTLTINEMRAFLLTADTLVSLLLAAHDGAEPDLGFTREPYERFKHFHDRIDARIPFASSVDDSGNAPTLVVSIQTEVRSNAETSGFELRVELSRLLYQLDREAYIEVLGAAERLAPAANVEADEVEEIRTDEPDVSGLAPQVQAVPVSRQLRTTDLSPLSEPFSRRVAELGSPGEDIESLSGALLTAAGTAMALDWRTRSPVGTAMRLAMRKVLIQSGFERARAVETAHALFEWLEANVDEVEP